MPIVEELQAIDAHGCRITVIGTRVPAVVRRMLPKVRMRLSWDVFRKPRRHFRGDNFASVILRVVAIVPNNIHV